MRVFILFEFIVIALFMYFVANLIRYFFFKETYGGKMFGLSDKWIAEDEKKKEKRR